MTTAIAPATSQQVATLFAEDAPLKRILKAAEADIQKATRGDMPAPALVRAALVQIASTPALAKLEQTREGKLSLVRSIFHAASLGLMVGGPAGEAAIIPYKGEAKLIPMVRGLVTLAIRAGTVKAVSPVAVYEGDQFEVWRGTRNEILHRPNLDLAGRADDSLIKYVYVVFQMGGGVTHFDVMNREEVERVRATSKAAQEKDGPWVNWWGEQAKKTVTKRASKMVPLSPEFRAAVELDNRFETGTINEPSDLLDSAEEVQAHVVETTKARTGKLREKLEASKKGASSRKEHHPSCTSDQCVPDCVYFADGDNA